MNSILIGYDSQTGMVEEISNILYNKLKKYKIKVTLSELNKIILNELFKYNYFIILVSTTGDGEFPDNFFKFWRKIYKLKKNKEEYNKYDFSKIKYCIFGFGDKSYINYCKPSKNLDKIFKFYKINKFYKTTFYDDEIKNEKIIENWIDNIVLFFIP